MFRFFAGKAQPQSISVIIAFLMLLACLQLISAQDQDDSESQERLKQLNDEIAELRGQIDSLESDRKNTVRTIEQLKMKRRVHLREIDVLQIEKERTDRDIEKLEELFGERVKKALELVGDRRVKKYLFKPSGIVRWVVRGGSDRDYLLLEHSFCSCKDFLFNALLRQGSPSCYHLLAREIAEQAERFEEIELEDGQYVAFMAEMLP